MAASQVPDLADILAARRRIASYLRPTPLYRYPALDAMTGAQAWVKHENHQPVGAFKVRGALRLVTSHPEVPNEALGLASGRPGGMSCSALPCRAPLMRHEPLSWWGVLGGYRGIKPLATASPVAVTWVSSFPDTEEVTGSNPVRPHES